MLDLTTYLRERAACIEAALDAFMPKADEPPAQLHEAMRYSVFSGGKRLRPALCLAAADACGADPPLNPLQGGDIHPAMLAAIAVELLHTYTLIHDDLPCMDDDDVRRGKPTSHKAFGEANAVLAGDALQALAFEAAAAAKVPAPNPPNQLVLELARAVGSRGVVGGQAEDLATEGKMVDAERVEAIHRHKTADLFRASLRMGAFAAGAGADALEALSVYGEYLGLAFQITDDLLDQSPGYAPAVGKRKAQALTTSAIQALYNAPLRNTEPLVAVAAFVLERQP